MPYLRHNINDFMPTKGYSLSTNQDYYSTTQGLKIDIRKGGLQNGCTETNQSPDGIERLDRLPAGEGSRSFPFHSYKYIQPQQCSNFTDPRGCMQDIWHYAVSVL